MSKNRTMISWMDRWLRPGQRVRSPIELMKILILLAQEGVANAKGGPFVAAIVSNTGRVISVAHNNVGRALDSTAHAEILAIRQAETRLKSPSLRPASGSSHTLVTTCQPCIMCAGAIHWAGLRRVVAAARHQDVLRAGIAPDLLPDASRLFSRVGIRYQRDVLRQEAARVFHEERKPHGHTER